MFSADLSWTDPDVEKVGERKERRARERSNSSAAPSVKSSKSSKSSIPDDRELWWPSSLKKAKGMKPTKRPRADTNNSIAHSRKASSSVSRSFDLDPAGNLKDPTLQPSWTYSSTLSSTLPSGASLDPPQYEVPELEGDLSSRRTNSSASRSSHERQWGWRLPGKIKVIDEVHEVQQLSPRSFVARTTRRSSESVEAEKEPKPVVSPKEKNKSHKGSYSVKIEGCLDLDQLKIADESEEPTAPPPQEKSSYANTLPHFLAWRPPSEWEVVLPSEHKEEKGLPPLPTDTVMAFSSTLELTRFQRFIRRMESAGPKTILDRVNEEWHGGADEEMDEELKLEKELWVLTAFQLQNLGRSRVVPRPTANTGKILELYGNLSEVYQLSAMHPRQKVHYLTTKPQQPIPLPGNVSYLTVPQAGNVPLPYSDGSFSHIRASTLPSIVPSAKLPQLFSECFRLLAPGGLLEIRIMDAAPIRRTAGPKMRAWIEDRLSINLEKLFRCSKPCLLVPTWVAEAGFDLPTSHPSALGENMKMPCAISGHNSDVDAELSTLVGRALWKNIWGGFVEDLPGESRWWWEDEEVMRECLERQTAFECGAIFAFKR